MLYMFVSPQSSPTAMIVPLGEKAMLDAYRVCGSLDTMLYVCVSNRYTMCTRSPAASRDPSGLYATDRNSP